MAAYYNEIDPFAAAWLRELITAGHIAPGDVDTRSIVDVRPSDLRGYAQCHFFAGIGVWSYALRRAGWPDNRPVWTGSCPCQPFSAAGKGGGFDDERHLWPAFYHLIGECGPPVVFGEQVASKDADPWIDLVQADMEALGYAFGAVPFPSAGIGAPHIRDRTYWLADASHIGHQRSGSARGWGLGSSDDGAVDWLDDTASARHVGALGIAEGASRDETRLRLPDAGREASRLDDDDDARLEGQRSGHRAETGQRQGSLRSAAAAGEPGGVADSSGIGRERWQGLQAGRLDDGADAERVESHDGPLRISEAGYGPPAAGPTNGLWRDADWLFCRDGKWRPVEPGTFPLAHGAPARVGRLRGYGNAINAEAAVAFIEAATAHEIVDLDAERLRLTGAFA